MVVHSSSGLSSLEPSSQSSAIPEPLSQISDINGTDGKRKQYRPARVLPYELRQHCITFVEEELYSQAFSLLLNLLIAGTDNNDHHENGRVLPAYVPPAQVIALAATLIVHPSTTTRATSAEQAQAADDALFYLTHLNALVGPFNSNFGAAFEFASANSVRPGRRRGPAHHEDSPELEDDHGKVHVRLANDASVWNVAEDFWRVVGWAFNCSVTQPKRWDRWLLWLKLMLDVLEDDLQASIAAAKVKENAGDRPGSQSIMSASLLARYLSVIGESRTEKRRVMRAILADGGKKSLAEFGEVWKNETKEKKPPKESPVSKSKGLNVYEGDYGDYMDADEDEEDEDANQDDLDPLANPTSTITRSMRKRTHSESSVSDEEFDGQDENVTNNYGGQESISLRQRFMTLLFKICTNYDSAFMEAEDLSGLFTEFLRPLPLSVFVQFILPTAPYLEPHSQTSVNVDLLSALISSDAPTCTTATINQAVFERHFLPFPANYTSHLENARVSVLVESLLRLLMRYLDLEVTASLRKNLAKGIKARREKAAIGARKRGGKGVVEDDFAAGVLEMSAVRMDMLVAAVAEK